MSEFKLPPKCRRSVMGSTPGGEAELVEFIKQHLYWQTVILETNGQLQSGKGVVDGMFWWLGKGRAYIGREKT